MALHFPIMINGETIGRAHIRRQHPVVPGEPSEYAVQVDYPLGTTSHATVYHLYEDGALALIASAMLAALATKPIIAPPGSWIAPFSPARAELLNRRQFAGRVHPYTCGNDSNHPPLIALRSGWTCLGCDYTQQWAHPIGDDDDAWTDEETAG